MGGFDQEEGNMRNFKRKEIADKAVAWCIEHDIEPSPVGIVSALDALELLNDPAAQQMRASDPPSALICSAFCAYRYTGIHNPACQAAGR